MKSLITLEIKNILKSKKFILLIIFHILCMSGFFIYNVHSNVVSVIESGEENHKIVFGTDAIEISKERDKSITGYLDKDKITKAYEVYMSYLNEEGEEEGELDKKYFSKYIPYGSIYTSFQFVAPHFFEKMRKGEMIKPQDIPFNDILKYYDNRLINQKSFFKDVLNNKGIKLDFILEKMKEVRTPFYYDSFYVMDSFIENFTFFLIMIMVFTIVLCSSSFLEHSMNNEMSLIKSTKYGRKHFAISKIAAYNLISVAVYIISYLAIVLLSNLFLNKTSLDSSIQWIYFFSALNYTIKDYLILQFFVGLSSVVALTNLLLYLSYKMGSYVNLVMLSCVIVFLPIITSKLGGIPDYILNLINSINPANGSILFMTVLVEYRVVAFFNKCIPIYNVYMIANIITSLIFIKLLLTELPKCEVE